jgi:dihydropyrimidinase
MTQLSKRLLIKSGTVVSSERSLRADVLVEGEKIIEVGEDIQAEDVGVVDASGKLVLPGGVDPHTHFDLEMFDTVSSDDHYTGHKAAAFGGTTTVMDFVPQTAGSTLKDDIAKWHAKADGKAAVDWGFHMNITHLDEQVEREIPTLLDEGINTLKVFMAYNGRLRLQDHEILRVLQIAKENNMLTMVHAEDGDEIETLVANALAAGHTSPAWHARTRPAQGAVDAVRRVCALAADADASLYVVHMNTAGGAKQLEAARQRGAKVMGETCPQYLFFTEEDLNGPEGTKWIASPPMRTAMDNEALWKALADNGLQTLGTDHCPFFFNGTHSVDYEGMKIAISGKELGADDFTKIPNGLPMVGDRLPLVWTFGVGAGKLSQEQFVALTSENPAKIFGLYPRKGAIQSGSDADFVIWDPNHELTYGRSHSHHRTDYNLFEGWKLIGFPEQTYLRGQLIVDRGEWLGQPGMGEFLKRSAGGEII